MAIISSDRLRAEFDPRGARLTGLWIDDRPHSLVLGPGNAGMAQAPELAFFGVLVGPVANRIGGAQVTIDGKLYQMTANESSATLHSGPEGTHAQLWETTSESRSELSYALTLRDGTCGLPGNREITATYQMSQSSLELIIEARSDAVTVMNIAHHPYWNLNGAGTVADHVLRVEAEQVLELNAQTLPTGRITDVAGTDYDFRTARSVPTDRRLDVNLCLSPARVATPRPVAYVSAPGGPSMVIETTEPGLQVYNGYGLKTADVTLHAGQRLGRCAGLALEPQSWPDAPNQTDFPSILLTPNETYRQVTRYCFH